MAHGDGHALDVETEGVVDVVLDVELGADDLVADFRVEADGDGLRIVFVEGRILVARVGRPALLQRAEGLPADVVDMAIADHHLLAVDGDGAVAVLVEVLVLDGHLVADAEHALQRPYLGDVIDGGTYTGVGEGEILGVVVGPWIKALPGVEVGLGERVVGLDGLG